MSRTATGFTRRRRHNKILKATKGYYGARSKLYRTAKEAYIHAGEYAFAGRKLKKRAFRQLWISRISEAVKLNGLSYSTFLNKLKANNIEVDRKVLANLIVENPEAFAAVLQKVKTVN